MKRRDFIRKSIQAGAITGFAASIGGLNKLYSMPATSNLYDMVAVKGGDAVAMFDQAIAALGGMKEFVKPNQTVVLKPNIGWDKEPEYAANTNPFLVKRIIEHCKQAGAKTVYVFDHTCHEWTRCYKNSGIEKAVKDAGGKMVPGNSESNYQHVEIPRGVKLKDAKVHELVLDSDVFINIPILKHHGGAKISIAMKNLMGVVWDRGYWHKNDLHQCIADFPTYRKPDLNIIDAYRVMKKNGPIGVSKNDVALVKSQLISTDIVTADAAATRIFGNEINDIDYIMHADELGLGNSNLSEADIKKIKI